MSSLIEDTSPVSTNLAAPIEVGEPDVTGALAVYPLFGPAARLDYLAFGAAHEQVAITELEGAASVRDLLVHNTADKPVLLYEGEEVLGAQQNRVLDVSILIAANAKTRIPVSCVEQGRWDGRRHRERFRPSQQTADPRMRKLKAKRARMNAAAGLEARPDQGEVWDEVAERSAEMEAHSPTGAMSDIFDQRRDQLSEMRDAIKLHDGQCGAVAVIGGRISMLDFVGRPDVFAALQSALVAGYALDALALAGERDAATEPVDGGTVRGFTLLACDARAQSRSAGPGLGETRRFADGAVEGSALVAEGELVQLTAFPAEGDEDAERPRARRINAPSRRRR